MVMEIGRCLFHSYLGLWGNPLCHPLDLCDRSIMWGLGQYGLEVAFLEMLVPVNLQESAECFSPCSCQIRPVF